MNFLQKPWGSIALQLYNLVTYQQWLWSKLWLPQSEWSTSKWKYFEKIAVIKIFNKAFSYENKNCRYTTTLIKNKYVTWMC